jgi:hypothetical protein
LEKGERERVLCHLASCQDCFAVLAGVAQVIPGCLPLLRALGSGDVVSSADRPSTGRLASIR